MEFSSSLCLLQDSIEVLTQKIFEKINDADFAAAFELIIEREKIIAELIELSSTYASKGTLNDYFLNLRSDNEKLIKVIHEERSQLRNIFLNIKHVEKYINA